jgi:hypothetical protein
LRPTLFSVHTPPLHLSDNSYSIKVFVTLHTGARRADRRGEILIFRVNMLQPCRAEGLKRIWNYFYRAFQGQQPVFAVAAVAALFAVTEDVPLDILFDQRGAIGAEGVP